MLTPQDLTSIKQLLGETEANLTSQIKTNTLKLEMVEKRLERVEIDLAVNTKGVVGVKKKVTKLEQETHFLRESLNATIDNFDKRLTRVEENVGFIPQGSFEKYYGVTLNP